LSSPRRRKIAVRSPADKGYTPPRVSSEGDRLSVESSAKKAIINSVAFPKVAFKKPPILGPEYTDISSVASPMSPASGIIASAAVTKTKVGLNFITSKTILTGININKYLRYFIFFYCHENLLFHAVLPPVINFFKNKILFL